MLKIALLPATNRRQAALANLTRHFNDNGIDTDLKKKPTITSFFESMNDFVAERR